ncbi:MAG: transcription antitermination factor NusB [Christensenellaceae bacterium]|nr:transcription antitermination factor NusB [Christensenellaceae bacterium]
MSRRAARDTALRLFYEYAITGEFNPATMDVMRDCFDKGMNDNAWAYVARMIELYKTHKDEVDAAIQANSKNWNISHMAKVELSILRIGVCELYYCDDIHESITINECVELGKKYASDKSARFINGVLGAVLKSSPPVAMAGQAERVAEETDVRTE